MVTTVGKGKRTGDQRAEGAEIEIDPVQVLPDFPLLPEQDAMAGDELTAQFFEFADIPGKIKKNILILVIMQEQFPAEREKILLDPADMRFQQITVYTDAHGPATRTAKRAPIIRMSRIFSRRTAMTRNNECPPHLAPDSACHIFPDKYIAGGRLTAGVRFRFVPEKFEQAALVMAFQRQGKNKIEANDPRQIPIKDHTHHDH